eukprot:1192272-Prorocentrum_minimum.AAC.2
MANLHKFSHGYVTDAPGTFRVHPSQVRREAASGTKPTSRISTHSKRQIVTPPTRTPTQAVRPHPISTSASAPSSLSSFGSRPSSASNLPTPIQQFPLSTFRRPAAPEAPPPGRPIAPRERSDPPERPRRRPASEPELTYTRPSKRPTPHAPTAPASNIQVSPLYCHCTATVPPLCRHCAAFGPALVPRD